jgi:hypothetical protein
LTGAALSDWSRVCLTYDLLFQVMRSDSTVTSAAAAAAGLTGDFTSEVLRLRYSSLTTPPSVYDQHMATGTGHTRGLLG